MNRDPLDESGANLLVASLERVRLRQLVRKLSRRHYGENLLSPVADLRPGDILNLYGYVGNNSVNLIDAFGLVALPPGWSGPGRPYDPSMNPFCGPPPRCAAEVAAVAASTLVLSMCIASAPVTGPVAGGICAGAIAATIISVNELDECLGANGP